MGLFSKKEEKEKDAVPNLPELPPLPSTSSLEGGFEELPKLPSFPKNNLGEKFSQDTIKKAINGKKEEEKEIFEENDFAKERKQMIPESPKKNFQYGEPRRFITEKFSEEIEEAGRRTFPYAPPKMIVNQEIPEGFEEAGKKIREIEPIFVRIDKFQESKRIFERTKEQIFEIEKALNKIKSIKQEEDRELASWEQEILNIKDKISQIEKDIFSKV